MLSNCRAVVSKGERVILGSLGREYDDDKITKIIMIY
jgi:hypothetical protein